MIGGALHALSEIVMARRVRRVAAVCKIHARRCLLAPSVSVVAVWCCSRWNDCAEGGT